MGLMVASDFPFLTTPRKKKMLHWDHINWGPIRKRKQKYAKGGLTAHKAEKMLHEKKAKTSKQRRFFSWVAGGRKPRAK